MDLTGNDCALLGIIAACDDEDYVKIKIMKNLVKDYHDRLSVDSRYRELLLMIKKDTKRYVNHIRQTREYNTQFTGYKPDGVDKAMLGLMYLCSDLEYMERCFITDLLQPTYVEMIFDESEQSKRMRELRNYIGQIRETKRSTKKWKTT